MFNIFFLGLFQKPMLVLRIGRPKFAHSAHVKAEKPIFISLFFGCRYFFKRTYGFMIPDLQNTISDGVKNLPNYNKSKPEIALCKLS
jgi:hypothetical protein